MTESMPLGRRFSSDSETPHFNASGTMPDYRAPEEREPTPAAQPRVTYVPYPEQGMEPSALYPPQVRGPRPVKRHPWLKWLIWTLVGPVALLILSQVIAYLGAGVMVSQVVPNENTTETIEGMRDATSSGVGIALGLTSLLGVVGVVGAPILGFVCLIGTIVSVVRNNGAYQLALSNYDERPDTSWY